MRTGPEAAEFGSSSSVGAAALIVAALALACGLDRDEGARVCEVERVYHGLESSVQLGLGAKQLAAIVAVYPPDRATICSGVVVAEGVVLTAKHCTAAEQLVVGYWAAGGIEVPVEAAVAHPTLDVAVLFVDSSALADELDPIPLIDSSVDETWIGHPVELAGYGFTEDGQVGLLRFAAEPIVAIDEGSIVVHGHGRSGACSGDSGGPLLGRDDNGRVRTIGLLDSGHASCVENDRYVRTDVLASWWPFDWQAAGAIERGCEGLDAEGLCVRDRAIRCDEDGHIVIESCADGSACGQRAGTASFTCVAPEEDVCDGVGSLPVCEGDVVVACADGDQARVDCSACGRVCADWTATGGANCVDEPLTASSSPPSVESPDAARAAGDRRHAAAAPPGPSARGDRE